MCIFSLQYSCWIFKDQYTFNSYRCKTGANQSIFAHEVSPYSPSSLSVWAVTTCWSLLSRRTPACSVGATDSPATKSRTASLSATCQLVRCTFLTTRCFQSSLLSCVKPTNESPVTEVPELSERNIRDVDLCLRSYVSSSSQATTRCSSSLLEPPPSASENQWPLATTFVSLCLTS